MKGHMIEKTDARQFKQHLESLEYAPGSIEKYVRDFLVFQRWAGHRAVGKEDLLRWKASLQAIGYRPETVNAKLAALNCFFRFKGWDDCCVKYLKIQRRLFRSTERADQSGIPAADRNRGAGEKAAFGTADGDDLRHGHPSQRGEIYHGGCGSGGPGKHCPKGKNPHYPDSGQAAAEAL